MLNFFALFSIKTIIGMIGKVVTLFRDLRLVTLRIANLERVLPSGSFPFSESRGALPTALHKYIGHLHSHTKWMLLGRNLVIHKFLHIYKSFR